MSSSNSSVEKSKKSVQTGTYLILGAALAAMTFFGVCDPGGGYNGPKGSAAVVGDEVIGRGEFQRTYQNIYDQYKNIYQESFDAGKLKVAQSAMQQLVNSRLLYLRAKDLGLAASESEVIEAIKSYNLFVDEKGNWSDTRYDTFLQNYGFTEKDFMDEIKRNVTLSKARQWLMTTAHSSKSSAEIDYKLKETKYNIAFIKFDPQTVKVNVNDADITKFLADEANKKKVEANYKSNMKKYDKAEEIKASHILISYKESRNASGAGLKRTKEEAQKLAAKIAKQAQANPDNFAELAKKETDEAAGKTSGGSLGWFTSDAMVPEFSKAAFALKKNEISDAVESPFGFHIIKKEDSKPAQKIALADAEKDIAKTMLAKELRPAQAAKQAEATLAALNAGDPTAQLKQYDVKWENTGEVSVDTPYLKGIGATDSIDDVLVTLKKEDQLAKNVIDVRGSKFILKLKSRTEPDLSKLDAAKREELAMQASTKMGNELFETMRQQAEVKYKDEIWRNPEYLALDTNQPEAGE